MMSETQQKTKWEKQSMVRSVRHSIKHGYLNEGKNILNGNQVVMVEKITDTRYKIKATVKQSGNVHNFDFIDGKLTQA